MFRFAAAAVLSFLCAAPLGAVPLVRLVTLDYPPYASPALAGQGAMVTLAREAFEQAGYQVSVTFLPWGRLAPQLSQGRFDAGVGIWPSDCDALNLVASRPLFSSHLGLYYRRERPTAIRSPADLKGRRIGITDSYNYPVELAAAGWLPEVSQDDLSSLHKLDRGDVPVVLLEKAVGDALIERFMPNTRGVLVWQEPPLTTVPLSVGFPKALPGADTLRKAFDSGLRRLHANGRYRVVVKQFGLERYGVEP